MYSQLIKDLNYPSERHANAIALTEIEFLAILPELLQNTSTETFCSNDLVIITKAIYGLDEFMALPLATIAQSYGRSASTLSRIKKLILHTLLSCQNRIFVSSKFAQITIPEQGRLANVDIYGNGESIGLVRAVSYDATFNRVVAGDGIAYHTWHFLEPQEILQYLELQPMLTVPMDGTEIDIYKNAYTSNRRITNCRYSEHQKIFHNGDFKKINLEQAVGWLPIKEY